MPHKLAALLCLLAAPALAQSPERTLAPYFHVTGSAEVEQLPLKESTAEISIAGVIARVQVRQVYVNEGFTPIEALYVFPASTKAAVHGMRMKIGQRTLEARIEKRAVARQAFEDAKAMGQRASLLEQQRPNVFTMEVTNLMPRDRVEVLLDYTELLVPDEGVYQLVYPAVVGPRYGGGADPVKDTWISNPYLPEGEKEPYHFGLKVHVESGITLQEMSSPSHRVRVSYAGPRSADVSLDQPGGGTKDFILRYRLAAEAIESGVLTWRGEKESFFAFMMEPPKRPSPSDIPPREYVFLLDVSGSMNGFPLETAKSLMRGLLSGLRPTDSFNLVLFAGSSFVMKPEGSVAATSSEIDSALALVDQQRGGGGTELLAGLKASYAIPRREGVARTVVVVTDGYVGVEAQTFKFVSERANEANCFAFGIGSSVNRALIEGLARAGQAEPFVVSQPDEASSAAGKFRQYVEQPVLTNINVRFAGLDAYEVVPGKLADLMARRPVVLFGKFRGEARGAIEVSGVTGSGSFFRRVELTPASFGSTEPLKWLWARRWVESLEDDYSLSPDKEVEESISDLGLHYKLLTPFTSFVAVDSEVVNRGGVLRSVQQPLPLPQGVSRYAVGGLMGAGGSGLALGGMGTFGRGFGGEAKGVMGKFAAQRMGPPKPSARFELLSIEGAAIPERDKLGKRLAAALLPPMELAQRSFKLRVELDQTGVIRKVELVGKLEPALRKALESRVSRLVGLRHAIAKAGTLVLTLRVAR